VNLGPPSGCPFRVWSRSQLLSVLSQHKQGSGSESDHILSLAGQKKYSDACRSFLHLTHPGLPDGQLSRMHPNTYFDVCESYHMYEKKQLDEQKQHAQPQ
jgi:hypothetical protein